MLRKRACAICKKKVAFMFMLLTTSVPVCDRCHKIECKSLIGSMQQALSRNMFRVGTSPKKSKVS